jgi:hypothetical protein
MMSKPFIAGLTTTSLTWGKTVPFLEPFPDPPCALSWIPFDLAHHPLDPLLLACASTNRCKERGTPLSIDDRIEVGP